MKNKKRKAIVKESRKLAKKELTQQIVSALKTITLNLTGNEKKSEKLITKTAKQLAKKLAKQTTFNAEPEMVDLTTPKKPPLKKNNVKKDESLV